MPKPSKRDQLVEATEELLWEVLDLKNVCRFADPAGQPHISFAQIGVA